MSFKSGPVHNVQSKFGPDPEILVGGRVGKEVPTADVATPTAGSAILPLMSLDLQVT